MPVPHLGRVGLWTGALDGLSLAAVRDQVAELDAQGWGALWFHEAVGREAYTAASLYLAASSRMTVATGIASIYARDAMAAAAGARTLAAGGRFLLGLGVSHAPMVEGMRGQSYGKPLTAMRAYLDAMDAAVALVGPDEQQPAARVLAALGPGMLALAAERTEGAHTYLVTPEHTAEARAILGSDAVLAVEQAVVVSDDLDVWQPRADWHLGVYTGLPNYRNNWLRLGFSEDDLADGGSDRLKQAMVVRGLEAIRARVDEHLAAGASHVCLQVLGPDLFTAPVGDWRELAAALPA
ncbi:MAG: F420-dependent oxidoreductase [Frankiales bacterium]|nr:F420-dependent oxidoreductase [Frankiales bacterium]